MKTKRAETLLEICVARASRARGWSGGIVDQLLAVPDALRVAELVMSWALASVEFVHEERIAYTREYADYWGVTERQGERDRARLRALFDAAEFDALIGDVAVELRGRRMSSAADVLQAVRIDLGPERTQRHADAYRRSRATVA